MTTIPTKKQSAARFREELLQIIRDNPNISGYDITKLILGDRLGEVQHKDFVALNMRVSRGLDYLLNKDHAIKYKEGAANIGDKKKLWMAIR